MSKERSVRLRDLTTPPYGGNRVFTVWELLTAAASLDPIPGSEYHRGICELLGRALLDMHGYGEGTDENAADVADALSQVAKARDRRRNGVSQVDR